jgi:hypothetical protein
VHSQSDMIDLCRGSLVDLDMVKRQSTEFIQSTTALLGSQVRFVLDKGNECNECNRKITTNIGGAVLLLLDCMITEVQLVKLKY